MKLSRSSAIAVFALTLMAESEGEKPNHGRSMAKKLGVPPDALLKVLQRLARAGVLDSSRGRGGGFRLARSPEQITLLEIVEIIDGKMEGGLNFVTRIPGMPNTKKGIELAFGNSSRSAREFLGGTSIRSLMNHR